MKRSFWALPLCAIALGAFVMSAGAQRGGKGPGGGFPGPGGGPSDPGTPAPVVDQPFTLGKRTWPSKAAWIAAGGYCSTPVPSNESVLAVEAELAAAKKGAKKGGGVGPGRFGVRAAARTVNVYFHIIMDSAGNGDISDADLQAAIDHMNTAFAGQQPRNPFKISAQDTGDVPFRYRIAGIERVTNDTWYVIGDEIGMKTALRVGGAADLNIYTGDLGNTGALGWSWFPFWYAGFEFYDGIVMEKEAMIGGNYTGYNEGDVLVHEAGHWVGLYHTFQGSCFRPGDGVSDTPAEAWPYFGDPTWTGYPDTCSILAKQLPSTISPGRDPVENFMDYSDNIVMYQFTTGQAVRADKLMSFYRGL